MKHYIITVIILGLITSLSSQSYFKKYNNFPGGIESAAGILQMDQEKCLIFSTGERDQSDENWSVINKIISINEGNLLDTNIIQINKKFSHTPSGFVLNKAQHYVFTGILDKNIDNEINPSDILVYEIDNNANLIWIKTIGNPKVREWGKTIIQAEDGGYLIGGWRHKSPTSNLQEAFLLKTSATGDSLWMKIFTNPELSNHSEGKVLVKGQNNTCYYFYKTDYSFNYTKFNASTGDVIWEKSYPVVGIQRSAVFSVLIHDDGRLIATGVFSDQDQGLCTPVVWEIDSDGNILDEHLYSGQLPCLFDDDLLRTNDGDHAIVYRDGHHPRLVVYDRNFDVKFTKKYELESYMFPVGFIQLEDESFMIAGAEGATNDYTIWLIRTDPKGDLVSVTGPDINEDRIEIYPNPTSELLYIKGALPEDAKVNVVGEDGKIISSSMNVNSINMSNLSSGVYFINIFNKDKLIINKKVIKI